MSVEIPETVDLRKYIDTQFFGVRPHIRGRRVPVAMIAYIARAEGWGTRELAYQYSLTEAQAAAALLYYEEHKEEIDKQEVEEQRLYDEMKAKYGRR